MHKLVEKLHQITKINSNDHQIHLSYKWPVAHKHYQTVKILNDDVIRAMLELYPIIDTIELYAKKDSMSHKLPEGRGEFSCMLNLDDESTWFMSPV